MKPGDLAWVVRENTESDHVMVISVNDIGSDEYVPVGELVVFLGISNEADRVFGRTPNETWVKIFWRESMWYAYASDLEEVS
jgi:hypothetical protein